VEDFALTPAERALLAALNARGVRYIVVGMGAAVLEGAPIATQDVDLWFERIDDERIRFAAKDAGGFWISGFGMQPPSFGGPGLDRIDVVLTAHGLEAFATEYERTSEMEIDGIRLRILPLERVVASKRATNRAKDQAQMPALEATILARRYRYVPTRLVHVTERQKSSCEVSCQLVASSRWASLSPAAMSTMSPRLAVFSSTTKRPSTRSGQR
jgi:predicted nucleotidyltransferase